MTFSDKVFDWIDVLQGVKEDWPKASHRAIMLSEVIEFLREARVDRFLNPGRRFNLMQRDLEEFSARIARLENSVVVQRQLLESHGIRPEEVEQS